MSSNESIKKTFIVALVLCLTCAVVVSTAAVLLRPMQEANQLADIRTNILAVAGMREPGEDVNQQFEQLVTTRVIDFETGTYTDAVDPDDYDQLAAARDPAMSDQLSRQEDIAGIQRRERYGKVYLFHDDQGQLETILLPIRGYGLWGTLYGFIALEPQDYDVLGLGFYEHQETPGLGGEVDNPRWREQWAGKQVYEDEVGQVGLRIVKGEVEPEDPSARHRVQGLSGATLTSRGVQNMIQYWMGEDGYAQFLRNLKAGEA